MAPCITSISALKMVAHIMVCLQRRLLTKISTVLQHMHVHMICVHVRLKYRVRGEEIRKLKRMENRKEMWWLYSEQASFSTWHLNHSYLCSISQICHTVNMHFCFISKSHSVNSFGGKQVITQGQYKITVMNQHYKIFSFHKWATLLTCIIVLPNPTASVICHDAKL